MLRKSTSFILYIAGLSLLWAAVFIFVVVLITGCSTVPTEPYIDENVTLTIHKDVYFKGYTGIITQ